MNHKHSDRNTTVELNVSAISQGFADMLNY